MSEFSDKFKNRVTSPVLDCYYSRKLQTTEQMFAKLLKIFVSRCNIKTNIRSETPRLEGLHMSQDEHNKQKDITFIVELLKKESPEKVRDILVFIRSYLGK